MFISLKKASLIVSMMVLVSMVFTACAGSPTATQVVPGTGPETTATTGTGGGAAAASPTTGGTTGTTPAATTNATGAATGGATSAPTAAATTGGAAVGPVKNPDTMIWATIGDPETLDPAWAYDTASGSVIFNVYETLLFPKKENATDFVPMLATKWDISPDGNTYTFTIRKDVKFHDGATLTPQDVAYSIWRGLIQDRAGGPQWIMLQPFFGLEVQSFKGDVVDKQFGGDFAKATQAVEQAITFDDSAGTVTMHLKQPYGPMLQILTGTWAAVVSMPWVIKQGGWDGKPETAEKFHDPSAEQDELFKVMNGTGPFKFDRWAPGEEVDLSRNDNYWVTEPLWDGGPSGPAKMARAVIKNIPEFGTRFATFKTGDADIAYIDTQYISQVDPLVVSTCDVNGKCVASNGTGGIKVYKGLSTVSNETIFFNQKVNTTGGNNAIGSGKLDGNGIPPDFFADLNIRKAFNYCFDFDTYIKQVYNGEAIQGYGPIIQGELGFDPNQPKYSYDPAKCADAFKASTLKSEDGKSVWDTGFYVQLIYNTGNDQRKTAGEILSQGVQQVNPKFHVAVVDEPFALELKDQVAGRLPIFVLGWLEDFHDPHDWATPFLASGGTYSGSQGFAPELQKQLDQLITQGVQETDKDKRAQIYGQLQNLSYENALDIFVDQPQARSYQQAWVQGYYYNPTYPGIYFYVLSKSSGG